MSIAYFSPVSFILLFVFVLAIVAICFYRFPSLRTYRNRKNLLIYPLVLLLLGSIVFLAYDTSLGTNIVTYNVDIDNNQFKAGQVNQLYVTCENLGNRDYSFYLTIKGTNASLTVDNQRDYVQVSDVEIKIPFHFNAFSIHSKETKPILFTIDKNTPAFVLNFDCSVTATGAIAEVHGLRNTTANTYSLWNIPGPSIL
jgi:hypothetical protein